MTPDPSNPLFSYVLNVTPLIYQISSPTQASPFTLNPSVSLHSRVQVGPQISLLGPTQAAYQDDPLILCTLTFCF